uniref:Saposin B-type domain-containing protein n=1 Tax=Phytophthora ramorum TaxID=164328 RepID=H3HAY3_PHYRM
MKTALAIAVASTMLPAAFGWTDRWDHSKRFNAAGHAQLDCDGESQSASCCICKSIVFEIETQLNNTQFDDGMRIVCLQNDHDMDVVFRISEEKKRIKYSRSEARILEVLDIVCEQVPLSGSTQKAKKILSAACDDFVGEYEDELTRTFFDDFTPAKERPEKASKSDEL